MEERAPFPSEGHLAYLGPELGPEAQRFLEDRGFRLEVLDPVEPVFPEGADGLVLALGAEASPRSALQAEAGRRQMPCLSDLALLSRYATHLPTPKKRRVLISGSAGKTVTAALLLSILAEDGQAAVVLEPSHGFLNAFDAAGRILVMTAAPSMISEAIELPLEAAVILNLSEENGLPVSDKAKRSAAQLLRGAPLGILGADDTGTQSLLMAVRRLSLSDAQALLPISGGATLSDGWFAIDRAVFALRGGRTRRVSSYQDSPALIGEHFGQNAAAASACASSFGVSDDKIGAGLRAFKGLKGRFECIGAEGRIVFVDDRYASCEVSTSAAIAACPEVFWIGFRQGSLSRKAKDGVLGSFYLQSPQGDGPPVDNVVTFDDAEQATVAAVRAAQDLIRRDPAATPVVLFSPGAPGFVREGELFRVKALSSLAARRLSRG